MNGKPFLGCEADPRFVESITETLGLRRADGTKTLRSPGTQRSSDEVNSATDLSEDDNVPKRARDNQLFS